MCVKLFSVVIHGHLGFQIDTKDEYFVKDMHTMIMHDRVKSSIQFLESTKKFFIQICNQFGKIFFARQDSKRLVSEIYNKNR